jgi:mannose-1-phosphate guanylyltransferase
MVENGTDNIVISTDGHLVGVIGVSDLVVVHTAGATLVCPKNRAQEIKALLERIKQDPTKKQFL